MITFAIPLENKVLLSHFREAFSLLLRWGISEIIERLKEVQEASTETKKDRERRFLRDSQDIEIKKYNEEFDPGSG